MPAVFITKSMFLNDKQLIWGWSHCIEYCLWNEFLKILEAISRGLFVLIEGECLSL